MSGSIRRGSLLFLVSMLLLTPLGGLINEAKAATPDIIITGVIDGPLAGGLPKAIEVLILHDIADLSIYGLGSANNGGGSDGEEFTFPAVSATAGDFIYIAYESTGFTSWFGFGPDYTSAAASINGDDAIELFLNGSVIDVFGDINTDGSGQPWEYMDGWAYRVDGTGPDGSTFVLANWTFSGPNALDGETTNAAAAIPFPIGSFVPPVTADVIITGVIDGPLAGGLPKAIEVLVLHDIADLSIYGLGSANNGGGTDGEEFTFPAVSATAGDFIYIASESTGFTSWFGFGPDYTSAAASINGDDAIELFQNGAVIDVFGDINTDGSGQPWEYMDGWAYRIDGTGPDGSTFVLANWTFSGPNSLDGETTNAAAAIPFPIGSYSLSAITDIPPTVSSTNPTNGETGVALIANIDINFSEDVTVTGSWYDISCVNSGTHTVVVSGGAQDYVLNPDTDFSPGEVCAVSILASQVTDQDGPPDNMLADHNFSFTTQSSTASVLNSLVFNEVLPDPNSATRNFDTDGDGIAEVADEFLEIYNNSSSPLDISGLQFWDEDSDNYFTIPASTSLGTNGFLVIVANIADGSLPLVKTGSHAFSTGGALSLSNTRDNLVVYDPSTDQFIQAIYNGDTIDTPAAPPAGDYVGFSATATLLGIVQNLGFDTDGTSRALSPDGLTTNPVDHDMIAPGGTLATPGNSNIGSACGNPATLIHDIQGSGTASLEDGNIHTVEGIVVGDFQTSSNLSGFFIQEEDADFDGNPMTSEGIFVYDGSSPAVDVNVGDLVRVTGTVDEYYELTELTLVSDVELCSPSGTASVASVILPVSSLAVWEYYEGMLITIPQTLYATDNYNLGRYGEVVLSVGSRQDNPTNLVAPGAAAISLQDLNDRSRIQLEDGSTAANPNPAPYIGVGNTLRAGDTLPEITGVLSYAFDEYEIHPTGTVTFTRVNNRSAVPVSVGGTLKVASVNVLNYFSTIDDGSFICGPAANQECRGADTADEFTRQRDKIIAAIIAMDADVIGLMEMENHAADDALTNLINGLNTTAGPGTYSSINTGPIGTDAIKVAIVYKTATVTPDGAYAVLDSSVDPTFIDDQNRPSLAQTFSEIATGGKFTVAVNHLKSKGSDCDSLGDPDTGDGQGNCNLTRTSAATALVNWLATDPTSSGDPDFVIIGDLNSYAMEDPIAAIAGAGYFDFVNTFIGSNAYSYVYMGQKGYLNHALGNSAMQSQVTGVSVWHINADEPSALDYNNYNQAALYNADAYRSSDHDPVVIGLALGVSGPTVLYGSNTIPANGAEVVPGPTRIYIEFDQPVKSGDADSADYIDNYLLVETGVNGVFDTLSCGGGVATDDVQIMIDSASYLGSTSYIATLDINGNVPLGPGSYRLFICGTTSIKNLVDFHLNGDLVSGLDSLLDFTVGEVPEVLPETGFPMGLVTPLTVQPNSKSYSGTDMILSIPVLDLNLPIVGVPQSGDGWDVDWLGGNAGYLAGSAFPTWTGNTVITGHVWDALNQPGPFFKVKALGYDDQIMIQAWGQVYTYEVRETQLVASTNVNSVMQTEEYDWITLVTCEIFDPATNEYLFRRVVKAVLVDIR